MAASSAELTFLRGAKDFANSTILPGSGKHHANYYIEQYSTTDNADNMHEIMRTFPDMFKVGAKAGLEAPYDLVCQASASGTSSAGVFTVTAREYGTDPATTKSENDCRLTTNSPKGTFRFLGAYSENANDWFGFSLATGDFNGDGFQDLAVGAPQYDEAFPDASIGAVYVFFGGAGFVGKDLSNSETADATFIGKDGGDQFGYSISSGDLNEDGIDDLIVSAPFNDDNSNSDSNAGAVYVFYGSSSFTGKDLKDSDTADVTFYGPSSIAIGESVASGDLNGDGVADLIVGGTAYDSSRGLVYVFFGSTSFASKDLSESGVTASATFYGKSGADYFGEAVAVGDLNGDRIDDLIVGADRNDDAALGAGAVYVFFGGSSFSGKDLSTSGVTAGASFYGAEGNDYFGEAVAVGDLNGDGVVDLIVGADRNDDAASVSDAGAVYVFFGGSIFTGKDLSDSETASASFYGEGDTDRFGVSVASGDVNGDGIADLIAGAYLNDDNGDSDSNAGAAYVFYGGSGFTGKDLSDSETASAAFYGKEAGDLFGFYVYSGDVNGDGVADLIVAAYQSSDANGGLGSDAGAAYVILGKYGLDGIDFSD